MNIKVFKIGGQIVDNEADLAQFLDLFAQIEGAKILVHGGGKIASRLLERMHIEPKMHNGRRITDAETLEVVVMAYAGTINKKVVAQLQKRRCNALGFTGADGNIIEAHKRIVQDVDYGFAGDVDNVNTAVLEAVMAQQVTPVLAPITHDVNGQLLNTNADTIANSVASKLAENHEVELFYIFDKPGLLRDINDENSVVANIKVAAIDGLIDDETIFTGMLPKIANARNAVEQQVAKVVLTNIAGIEKLLNNQPVGTTITL